MDIYCVNTLIRALQCYHNVVRWLDYLSCPSAYLRGLVEFPRVCHYCILFQLLLLIKLVQCSQGKQSYAGVSCLNRGHLWPLLHCFLHAFRAVAYVHLLHPIHVLVTLM